MGNKHEGFCWAEAHFFINVASDPCWILGNPSSSVFQLFVGSKSESDVQIVEKNHYFNCSISKFNNFHHFEAVNIYVALVFQVLKSCKQSFVKTISLIGQWVLNWNFLLEEAIFQRMNPTGSVQLAGACLSFQHLFFKQIKLSSTLGSTL